MTAPFDLAVAWRIYPGVSKKPLIHSDDKFALVRTSLRSFQQSAQGLKISHHFILDGCPPEYEELIHSLFANEKHAIINTPKIGNARTFAKQIELLLAQSDADVVYFSEDDYLYRPGEFGKLHRLITSDPAVDFVSCYCHRDIFTHPLHQHERTVKYAADHMWMGDSSTCLTFMTTKRVLEETREQFLTYCAGSWDCSVWLGLTRTHLLNPAAYLKYRNHPESKRILRMAWKFGWRRWPFLRKYSLYVPFPGIGTHLEEQFVSPETDWLAVARAVEGR